MTPQEERMQQQLRKASNEAEKLQREYDEERKRVENYNEDEEVIATFFKRQSRGVRGGLPRKETQ